MFLYFLVTFCSEQKIVTNLEDTFTLYNPAVDENGRSFRFNYFHDYLIITYSALSTFIQLCYKNNSTYGVLESKNKFNFKNFRVDTQFQLTQSNYDNNGFAIIITNEQYTLKNEIKDIFSYKEKDSSNIVCKIFSNKRPYIELQVNDETKKMFLSENIYNNVCLIRLEHFKNVLKVFIKYGKDEIKHMFDVYGTSLKNENYYRICASNQQGDRNVKIFSVQTSSLLAVNATVKVKKSGGLYFWVVLVAAVCCLLVYLVKRQTRSPGGKVY